MRSSILSILLIFGLVSVSYQQFSCTNPIFGSSTSLNTCNSYTSNAQAASTAKAFIANLTWWNGPSGPANNTYAATGTWTVTGPNTTAFSTNYNTAFSNLQTFSACPGATWDINDAECLVLNYNNGNTWQLTNDTTWLEGISYGGGSGSTASPAPSAEFTGTVNGIYQWIQANLYWCYQTFYYNTGTVQYNQLGCCVYSVMYNFYHPFIESVWYSNQNQANELQSQGYEIWTSNSANQYFNGTVSNFILNDIVAYQNNGATTINCTAGNQNSPYNGSSGSRV